MDDALGAGQHHRYQDGEAIITQGQSADALYLIIDGEVEVAALQNGECTELARLGPGDYFGEEGLLSGRPRLASVFAAGDVEVVRIGREEVELHLAKAPDMRERLAEIVTARSAGRWTGV